MIFPEWLFREFLENQNKKINNRKSLKRTAREINLLKDTQLNKDLPKKMNIPYFFTDENLKKGFKINPDIQHINHTSSKLTTTPIYPEFGVEVRYVNEIIKEVSVISARLINQYKLRNEAVFSATFDKQDEDSQVLDETELFINLNFNQKLTESDLDNIDIKSPMEYQIQQQEMKDSGRRFHKINSMTLYFYQTGIMNNEWFKIY